ncbi:MAG TPA: primosomal protein N', partial [Deinococcales bacterium]|nr:primosomal protein N' [Deinococcales bacterium]
MLHGAMPAREREEAWRRARAGEVQAVFGTTLALLAPLPDLSLVVVEEEGSDAFKLPGGSRLFLPDGAALRARASGARLVLTGSVPAVESLPLPGVVLAPPRARLHVVNYAGAPDNPETGPLSNQPRSGAQGWPLSTELKRLLRQVAERGRQAVLVTPRRGYSAVLRCHDCGWVPYCPNCDVPLRLHAAQSRLQCHQCGFQSRAPEECPSCHGSVLAPRGPGSEWVHAELRRFLPDTPAYRYDRDRRDDLAPLMAGEPGVVAGTSAVLALPAPPDLALVALTFADTFVTHSDFRAGERFHALLRRLLEWHPTRAPLTLVQTFLAKHPALRSVEAGQDAAAYPLLELASREKLGYPPFALLAQVQVAGRRAVDADRAATELAALIRDRGAGLHDLLGPAPAPIPRIKGLFAYHMLVRAPDEARLAHLLEPARRYRGTARVRIDVNPREFSDLLE